MGANVFQCPQCSQINTTRRFTCKNCGANFEVALAGIEPMDKATITKYNNPHYKKSIMKKIAIFFIIIIVVIIIYTREKEIDKKCNVHNVNMKIGVVPIAYGLPGGTLLSNAAHKYCPNANTSDSGGCTINLFDLFHLFTRVSFCEKCREINKVINKDRAVLMNAVFELKFTLNNEDLNNNLTGYKNELASEISRLIIDDMATQIIDYNARYKKKQKIDKVNNQGLTIGDYQL